MEKATSSKQQVSMSEKTVTDVKENFKSDAEDSELLEKIKDSLKIPAPQKDDFWKIGDAEDGIKKQKRVLGIFNKKSLNEAEVNELRKQAIQSPGNTRTQLQKLKKRYPNNGLLLVLSAMCTYGMLLNSSNQREVVRGLKMATKEAAQALLMNELSVYNLEQFIRIYFAFLDRFKRMQIRTYEKVLPDPRLDGPKREILNAMQIVDQMLSEKNRLQKIINHLKKKLRSSKYITNFKFMKIREAANHIANGNPKEKCEMGTASETIAYVHAIASSLARIPILSPLVDKVLEQLPDSNKMFLLRKISLNSTRNLSKFRMASAEGDRVAMTRLGKLILKENVNAILKLEGQSLYQPFETDPFFNLAFVAEMTVDLYSSQDHHKILSTAIGAMDAVIQRDMSKNHAFTESATHFQNKLNLLKEAGSPAEAA